MTHDIDLVIFLHTNHATQLPTLFPAPKFYSPPPEVLIAEISRTQGGHFNVIDVESGLKADFYLAGRDELHAWAFRNAKNYTIGKTTVSLAPPEYVIIKKLEYFREGRSEKHLRDIRSMLSISDDQIDRAVLSEWTERRGLTTEWQMVSSQT